MKENVVSLENSSTIGLFALCASFENVAFIGIDPAMAFIGIDPAMALSEGSEFDIFHRCEMQHSITERSTK